MITTVYSEMIKEASRNNGNFRDQPLAEFVYDYYIHSFGFPKIADPKFKAFLAAVKCQSGVLRISIFSQFLGVNKIMNLTLEELHKFLAGMTFL